MAFHDQIKKQTNNLGDELKVLMDRVLPLVDPNLVSDFVEKKANEGLKSKLNADLPELVEKSPEELEHILEGWDSKQMQNLELLADLFGVLAKKQGYENSGQYREKALTIYQYITDNTATFSFARGAKISGLKQ